MTTVEQCTLRTGPHTIHLIRHHTHLLPAAILTWCGLRGIPHPAGPSAWRTCRLCESAYNDDVAAEREAAS